MSVPKYIAIHLKDDWKLIKMQRQLQARFKKNLMFYDKGHDIDELERSLIA